MNMRLSFWDMGAKTAKLVSLCSTNTCTNPLPRQVNQQKSASSGLATNMHWSTMISGHTLQRENSLTISWQLLVAGLRYYLAVVIFLIRSFASELTRRHLGRIINRKRCWITRYPRFDRRHRRDSCPWCRDMKMAEPSGVPQLAFGSGIRVNVAGSAPAICVGIRPKPVGSARSQTPAGSFAVEVIQCDERSRVCVGEDVAIPLAVYTVHMEGVLCCAALVAFLIHHGGRGLAVRQAERLELVCR